MADETRSAPPGDGVGAEDPEPSTPQPPLPPRLETILGGDLVKPLTRTQRKLLAAYAVRGTILAAAQVAGVRRQNHSEWVKTSPAYAAAFAEVEAAYTDTIEEEIRARAIDGWLEPVYHQGCLVGHTLKKSDKLLELHAKARLPEKYRERFDHTTGGQPLTWSVVMYGAPPASLAGASA